VSQRAAFASFVHSRTTATGHQPGHRRGFARICRRSLDAARVARCGCVANGERTLAFRFCRSAETTSPPSAEDPAEERGTIRLGHAGETRRGDQERSGGSLVAPAGRLYAKAAISATADWRRTVAGAASGAS
jgi:hypothetical protein